MKLETVTIQVPVELKDVILSLVSKICTVTSDQYKESLKDTLSSEAKSERNWYCATGKEEEREQVKEKILKEKEEEKREEFPPSREAVERFLKERRSPIDPARFYGWMTRNNWHDGRGDPITDWKAKAVEWEKREIRQKPYQPKPKCYMPKMPDPSKWNGDDWDSPALKKLLEMGQKLEVKE